MHHRQNHLNSTITHDFKILVSLDFARCQRNLETIYLYHGKSLQSLHKKEKFLQTVLPKTANFSFKEQRFVIQFVPASLLTLI
jgi:hypothetical protein